MTNTAGTASLIALIIESTDARFSMADICESRFPPFQWKDAGVWT
jgi:hypothetical protein